MSSLLLKYQSALKGTKGDILDEITKVTRLKYPTVREKVLNETFSYCEKKLIAEYYDQSIEDLFLVKLYENSLNY